MHEPADSSDVSAAPRAARVQDLLRPTLRRVAFATLIAAYGWAAFTFVRFDYAEDWLRLAPPVVLFAAALAGVARRQWGWPSALSLAAGYCLTAIVEMMVGEPYAAGLIALAAAVVTGLLLGPGPALVASGAVAAAALALPLPRPQLWLVLQNLGFGLALILVTGGSIHQALSRAEVSELRLWELVRDAQRRRGDLQKTSKALRDMYALLERTNRELEVARREAEGAREIKARFAANISHELRTPLNLIMGFSHTMYASPEVYGDLRWPPELRMDVHEIYSASRHLLGMIDDILDLSRVEAQRLPLRIEPADFAALATEAAGVAQGLLRGSEVRLVLDLPDDLPEVAVDRTRVRQVLLNLISNAIRFTDRGEIRLSARARDGELEVAVSDTGTGIPEADLATIFDEFSQASGPITSGRGGAGLGLAVCREFVRLHGGRIGVESALGQGSTFHFTLPLPDGGRARSRLTYYQPEGWTPPLPRNLLGKAAVVLAPDDTSARTVARGVSGYRAIPLTDLAGLAAVVEAEHPAGVVLVRDPLMPAEGPTAEDVWAATGRADLGVVEYQTPVESLAQKHLRVAAYLPKPVHPARLLDAIRESGAGHDRFLVVDDDAGFRTLMERVLHSVFPGARLRLCAGGEEGLAALAEEGFDVIILDLLMPGMAGVDMLLLARERGLLGEARVMVTTGASYADELAPLAPTRLIFAKQKPPRGSQWFTSITALLDAAPPDYSLPAAAPESTAAPQPSVVS